MISKGKRRNLVSRYSQLARINRFKRLSIGLVGLSCHGRVYSQEVIDKAIAAFAKTPHFTWDPFDIDMKITRTNNPTYATIQRGKHRNHAVDNPDGIKYEIDWASPKAFPHLIEVPNDQSGKTQVS